MSVSRRIERMSDEINDMHNELEMAIKGVSIHRHCSQHESDLKAFEGAAWILQGALDRLSKSIEDSSVNYLI